MQKYEPLEVLSVSCQCAPHSLWQVPSIWGKQCQPPFPSQTLETMALNYQSTINLNIKKPRRTKEWMGLRKPEVCVTRWEVCRCRSVGSVMWAGCQFLTCREREWRVSEHLPAPISTLGVPHVPQLIPLYPREAGCQIWEGGAWVQKETKAGQTTISFDTF